MDIYRRAGAEEIGYRDIKYTGDALDIEPFVGGYWSYGDIDEAARVVTFRGAEEERKSLDAEIVRRAHEWLMRHGPLA